MFIACRRELTKPHNSPGVATFFAFSVVELVSARVSGDKARPAVLGAEPVSSFFDPVEPVVPVDAERVCGCESVIAMRICAGEGRKMRVKSTSGGHDC